MSNFLIVHGAWTGAWSWQRVINRLIARGHRVHAPALSGLCERSHLAKLATITLSTHIDDIVNEATWNDLDQFVLVGHSYSGFVITGVAERLRERIASIVYLDAFIPQDGQCFADLFSSEKALPEPMVPQPRLAEGEYSDEADRAWVESKTTPQPTSTFTERLRVTGAYERVPKKTFIQASKGPTGDIAAALRGDPTWTIRQIESGHDVPVNNPEKLTDLLEAAASR
jgi:pimeloyl-ACP methyl ester carboxylesterase